ncbi:ATP-binding protein [Herbiconiux daphne]|uniref:ATP-binding protein n=1 Tax=Herbiconiux daphne TaxID=2970914 RepID=A0ABT2H1R5_9MICO|nr:ATP-binding protein [Herbiconiux daphne]MCS5733889.1 ATP-binding protein [Herbiconiux daphne]
MPSDPPPVAAVTARSIDGRSFRFSGPADVAVDSGRLVTLTEPGGRRQLGQIDDVDLSAGAHPGGELAGSGRILGAISADGGHLDNRSSSAFAAAQVADAGADEIELLHPQGSATLTIGSFLARDDVPARLLAQRFNRHTFWCGQSGSGKTYALGVVLEQVLLHTGLPLVIFDPNADFVRLGEPAGALGDRDIRVLRPSSADPDSLRVRFVDLPLRSKGAILRLHPLDDRDEYNELVHLEETLGTLEPDRIVPRLLERGTTAARDLAARIENIRVIDWGVWAGGHEAVTDIIETRPDATVLDLGGFAFPDESLVVAMAVLDDLWAKRERRRPVLLVIDEAHNLCSPDQTSPLHVAVRERLIQIAAEGRKFGLWLLLSTQRPSRVHPSIVSQCDNLALMKMTSPVDLDELATIFGFVPPALFARSPRFRQGEALFAGGFVPAPTMVRLGARLTREGGADVGVPLRAADPDAT